MRRFRSARKVLFVSAVLVLASALRGDDCLSWVSVAPSRMFRTCLLLVRTRDLYLGITTGTTPATLTRGQRHAAPDGDFPVAVGGWRPAAREPAGGPRASSGRRRTFRARSHAARRQSEHGSIRRGPTSGWRAGDHRTVSWQRRENPGNLDRSDAALSECSRPRDRFSSRVIRLPECSTDQPEPARGRRHDDFGQSRQLPRRDRLRRVGSGRRTDRVPFPS